MGGRQRSATCERIIFRLAVNTLAANRPAAAEADFLCAAIFIDHLHQWPDFGALILIAVIDRCLQGHHIGIALHPERRVIIFTLRNRLEAFGDLLGIRIPTELGDEVLGDAIDFGAVPPAGLCEGPNVANVAAREVRRQQLDHRLALRSVGSIGQGEYQKIIERDRQPMLGRGSGEGFSRCEFGCVFRFLLCQHRRSQ